ncbi:MAG: 2Fe-2S iron-sulfur cluster binding domain-containing protein [Acidobacteria bacterium]|nr:2Fe-2S iron-sulfur cluster binding domain-containing protein [Acidobacteriota bacterium]
MASHEPPRPGARPPDAEPLPEGESRLDFSRRNFLKTVGVGPLAASVVAARTADAQAVANPVGPAAVPIELTINGHRHALSVEPRVTLLDAIRDRLDLTGQKRVCDRGACGACTMLVDGRTIYACSMLAIEAQGADIRTVEGLTNGTVLHPVQEAFCEHDGLMCGFCTPGFVMATVALLEANPTPTADEARRALDGNICRCGTYKGVLEAALTAKGVRRG